MRVLHVINGLILAGVKVLIREMVPRQRERGLDVSITVLKELDSPLERDLRDMGTPFVKLPRLNIYDPRHALALRHVVGQHDITQANLFPAQLWVAAAAATSDRPPQLVTTEQSTTNNRRNFAFRPLDAWMYGRFAEVACNSEGTAKEFVRWLPKKCNRGRASSQTEFRSTSSRMQLLRTNRGNDSAGSPRSSLWRASNRRKTIQRCCAQYPIWTMFSSYWSGTVHCGRKWKRSRRN